LLLPAEGRRFTIQIKKDHMKKIVTLLMIAFGLQTAQAQTVVYDITSSDLPGSEFFFLCGGGLSWGSTPLDFSWTSTGIATPTSITVEFYEVWNDCEIAGIFSPAAVLLNAVSEGTYSSINTCAPVVGSVTLTPANYNVGGSNTFSYDYGAGTGAIVEWEENFTWGSDIYARVTVVYPLSPTAPVAVDDNPSVSAGSTGNVFDVQVNDSDLNGDAMTTTIINGPTSGGTAIVVNGDSISYDPPALFCGMDTIEYSVCDPGGLCDTAFIYITVGDAVAPTAVCQNINVYLDGAGNASIVAADIDGGSTDNCSAVTLSADITSFTCADVTGGPAYDLIITAAYDGPLVGGTPKGVELYVINNIADLSMYGLGSANNGGGTDGEEYTFPAVSAVAGQYIYIASDSAQFNAFFGFFPQDSDFSMTVNGDDAIELFYMGAAIDVFGDINVDGSGQPWDYADGWAYSNNSRAQTTTFNSGDWTYSGINALDGETTNGTATTPVPVGTYTSGAASGVSVTLTVTDVGLNSDNCTATVSVLDTIAPTFGSCPGDMTINADVAGCMAVATWTAPVEADNCSGVTATSSANSGDTLALGVNTITYTATDASGNTSTCTFDVTVVTALAVTVTSTDVLCNGDSTGIAAPGGTGNVGPVTYDFGTMNQAALPAGTHLFTVTDSIGCMVTDSVTITEPDAIVLTSVITDENNGDGSGAIDLTVTGGAGGNTFDWDNDGTGDFDDLEDLSGLNTGTYSVIVIDANGCTDTLSGQFVDNVVGVFEQENSFGVDIYPNPSNGQFVIEAMNVNNVDIQIIDILGKTVQHVANADARTNMDLGNARPGIYLIKITSGDDIVTKRVTIRK
jgi:hypothetical protein